MSLIRDVILASASIPGALPPVEVHLEYPDGNVYDELHADGGITSQIFLFPPRFPVREVLDQLRINEEPTAYLIRNAVVLPRYDPLKPRLIPITTRMVESLLRTQGNSDLFLISEAAMDEGIKQKLTWLPEEVLEIENREMFDPSFMRALYELGYERAKSGDAWLDFDGPLSLNASP